MSLLGDLFKNPKEHFEDVKDILKDPFSRDGVKGAVDFLDPGLGSLYGTLESADEPGGIFNQSGPESAPSPYSGMTLSNAGMEALPAAYQRGAPAQWQPGVNRGNPYLQGPQGPGPSLSISMPQPQAQQQAALAQERYRAQQLGLPNNQNTSGKYNQLAYDLSQGNPGQSSFEGGEFNYERPPSQTMPQLGQPNPTNYAPQRLNQTPGNSFLSQGMGPGGFNILGGG